MKNGYAELHARSNFTFLEGGSHPEALTERAQELGLAALALTDRDGLYGSVRFTKAASAIGLAAICGAEVTFEDGACLVLLVEDETGYAHLTSLLSRGHLRGSKGAPRLRREDVASRAAGLIALSGGRDGLIRTELARERPKAALAQAAWLRETFPDRAYVELQHHLLAGDARAAADLAAIAQRIGLPLVATNGVVYARREHAVLADVLTCVKHKTTLDHAGTLLRPNHEFALKSPAEMTRLFAPFPSAIRATLEIAERAQFRLGKRVGQFPNFPLPACERSEHAYLARLVYAGACTRYRGADGLPVRVAAQIAHELAMIERMRLAGYFLVVWDIVREAQRLGVLCQGRGSAANSIVCYALGITAIDPVQHELLFERFLNEDRKEVPDIDIDFAHQDREQVLQYVYRRWDREHAAMVAEIITYRTRSAIRDVGKALGLSLAQVDAVVHEYDARESLAGAVGIDEDHERDDLPASVARRRDLDAGANIRKSREEPGDAMPRARSATEGAGREVGTAGAARDAAEASVRRRVDPTFARANVKPRPGDHYGFGAKDFGPSCDRKHPTPIGGETGARLLELCRRMNGFPRHLGIHSGGMVITRDALVRVAPVEWASMRNRTVIQWDKDDLNDLGLIKIDLLGLGMLSLLRDAFALHARAHPCAPPLTLHGIPVDDPQTYEMLQRADSIGVFQVESRAQQSMLPQMKPAKFYDLVMQVAIIRPGPIQGGMIHPFLRRRAGLEPVTYPHPTLKPILERTLGVPLFQEQGMRMVMEAGGFTAAEADELRRAMGHKRSRDRMHALYPRFMQGLTANGISATDADALFAMIQGFADYGFPESHAASFALLAYVSGYMKAHHPNVFLAAILNVQPMGFYSTEVLLNDAKRHAVHVRPVAVNASELWSFVEPGGAVRLGYHLIRGIGAAQRALVATALAHSDRFTDLSDFAGRTKLAPEVLEHLAAAGVFARWYATRRDALWAVRALDHAGADPRMTFDFTEPDPTFAPLSASERGELDLWSTGLSLGGQPMLHYRAQLTRLGVRTATEIVAAADGSRVRAGGLVITRQRPGTAKGYVFLTLEDETGLVNVIVRPQIYDRFRRLIRGSIALVIDGVVQNERGTVNVVAQSFKPFETGRALTGLRSRNFR